MLALSLCSGTHHATERVTEGDVFSLDRGNRVKVKTYWLIRVQNMERVKFSSAVKGERKAGEVGRL